MATDEPQGPGGGIVNTAITERAELNQEAIQLIKDTVCKGATDAELKLFVQVCNKTRLDPFSRQIWAVKRYSSETRSEIMTFQVSIDGLRLTAQRSGDYLGQTAPQWCGKDGQWVDVWLEDTPPSAARVGVHRAGFNEPCYGVATWRSYAPTYVKNGVEQLSPTWRKLPDVMLAKCAEALALRKAFPLETSGLYIEEEMDATPQAEPTKRRPAKVNVLPPPVSGVADAANMLDKEIEAQNPKATEVTKTEPIKSEVTEPEPAPEDNEGAPEPAEPDAFRTTKEEGKAWLQFICETNENIKGFTRACKDAGLDVFDVTTKAIGGDVYNFEELMLFVADMAALKNKQTK